MDHEALAEAKIKSPAKFAELKQLLVFLVATYGTYGTNIRPAQTTIAEDIKTGISSTTVGRRLRAAVTLGLLSMTKAATSATPAVYAIAPFWLSVAVLAPEVGDPWGEASSSEPPY